MNSGATPSILMQLFLAKLDFALVFGSMVLGWLLTLLLGGFKFGRLLKQVVLTAAPDQFTEITARVHQRINALGFRPGDVPGQYLQGGSAFDHPQDFGAFTHAKVRKQLDVASDQTAPGVCQIHLTLQYLDPIVGDTGESAYRDAVLDYISGKSDVMKIVPNLSFAAVTSFVGGIVAWIALFTMKAFGFTGFVEPLLVVGGTYTTLGIIAFAAISQKPGQSKGKSLAIAGALASATAAAAALLIKTLGFGGTGMTS
jgi:hypothetical protein